MKYCAKCPAEIPEGHTVCPACGAKPVTVPDVTAAHINLMKLRVERDSANVKLRTELAELYFKNGLIGDALAEYKKIAESEPGNYHAHLRCAQILFDFKHLDQAAAAFRSALHINPKDPVSLLGLFRIFYLQHKTDEAIALGEKLIAAEPANVEYHLMLKNLYQQKGDEVKTMQILNKLEAIVPNNEQVIRDLIHHYRKSGEWEKARSYYDRLIGIGQDDVEFGCQLGRFYEEQKRLDEAIKIFEELLNRGGLPPGTGTEIRLDLALIHAGRGDLKTAQKLTADILSPPPAAADSASNKKFAQLLAFLGRQEMEKKHPKPALDHLKKAVYYDPVNPSYQDLLTRLEKESTASRRRLLHRTLQAVSALILTAALVFFGWNATHNRIYLQLEPNAQVTVTVDGKMMPTNWVKPDILASPVLTMGQYRVAIERPGFEPWQGTAVIGFARRGFLAVTMKPIFFSLRAASVPESATVTIDGQIVGQTPVHVDRLLAVPHEIEISAPFYAVWRSRLNVERPDSIDLGVIKLKNLSGTWSGKIGSDAYTYNASFTMTVSQQESTLKITYYHQPIESRVYRGEFGGVIRNGRFHAEGNVNYSEVDVFFLSRKKKRIVFEGALSDDWSRIEGKHFADGLGDHTWWAVRQP